MRHAGPSSSNRRSGFTLVEIMITVAIIGILVALAAASFLRARDATRTRAIQKGLTVIDDATRQWVIEKSLGPNDTMPTLEELLEEGYIRVSPKPPVRGTYFAATAYSELGEIDPNAYPRFEPEGSDGNPQWVHPDLLPDE